MLLSQCKVAIGPVAATVAAQSCSWMSSLFNQQQGHQLQDLQQ
jgi:hypothetical protein